MKKKVLSFFILFCLILINSPISVLASSSNNSIVLISESLNKLRNYYSNIEMNYFTALAYRHSSNDAEKDKKVILKNLEPAINNSNVMNCFKGIMGAVSVDADPSDFECNGKKLNYVSGLLSKYNKVKYNFYSSDDTNAYCIIALDMAETDYEKENVISALVSNFERNKSIRKAPIVLTALAKHKDLPGVEEGIHKYKEYIKSLQKDDGGFDGSGSYYPAPTAIASVIQAVIALGEDPLSEEWTKNGKTMLDALLSYQNAPENTFSDTNMTGFLAPTPTKNDMATASAFAALADIYKGKSMYEGFKENINPIPQHVPTTIDVMIDGQIIENVLNMKVEQIKNLHTEIKDQSGIKIDGIEAKLNIVEGDSINLENGKITGVKEGSTKIKITYEKIEKEIIINVGNKEIIKPEKVDKKEEINNVIKEIKQHYLGKEEKYECLETMSLIFSGVNKDDIKSKVKIYNYDDSIKCLAQDIMTLKVIGEDPTNYKGKNYVELLKKINGEFYNYNSYGYIFFVSEAILALDIVGADYDKAEAVKALMSKAIQSGNIVYCGTAPNYNTLDISRIVLAIANHRDVEGVEDFIQKYKTYLKKVQLNNGRFNSSYGSESSSDLVSVIQALVAIGENPLSSEWTKVDDEGNKITMIDVLLSYKEGAEFKLDNNKYSKPQNTYTQVAFAALLSLLNEKSIYTNIGTQQISIKKININSLNNESQLNIGKTLQLNVDVIDELDNKILGKEIIWESSNKEVASVNPSGMITAKNIGNSEITAKLKENQNIKSTFNIQIVDNSKNFIIKVIENKSFKNGNDANVLVKVISNIDKEKETSIIVALYNMDNNKMESYCCNKKSVKSKGEEIFKTGFSIPMNENYKIKIFAWDDMYNMNPYSESIDIDVEK